MKDNDNEIYNDCLRLRAFEVYKSQQKRSPIV